jgi:hypothetical protein
MKIAAAFALIVAFASADAHASPVRLSWNAPGECPSQATVVAEIERLLGSAGAQQEPPLEVSAHVDRLDVPGAAPVWRVRIQAGWPGGTPHTRELRAPRCGVLAGASALVVAMMIEPLVGGAEPADLGERPLPPPAVLSPPPVVVPPRPPVPPPADAPKPDAEPEGRFVVAAHAGGVVGALPGVAFGFGGDIGVVVSRFRVDLGMVHYLATDATLPDAPDRGASVTLTTARLSAAFLPLLDPVEVGPRVGIEVGSITAEGFGVGAPGQGGSAWIAPFLGVVGAYRIGRYFAVRVDVAFAYATIRPSFVLEPQGPVYEVGGPVGFLAGAAEARF